MTNQHPVDSSATVRDWTTEYAQSVVSGEIIAGPHVRAACRRHLKDLEEAPKRGFFFDRDKASWIIEFCQEVICLNGGQFEGVPFDPLPWQKFILGSLFGWVDADGYRRFQKCFIETSKGSGKSPLAGAIGLFGLMADGEARAEVYAAATKKDQAMILFRDAVAMVDQSPELNSRLTKSGTGENCWNLAFREAGAFFRPISADDGQSGPRPHIALIDEVHEHKNSNVLDMMEAGFKFRRQPLMFMITNSGYDKNTVCWKYHEYAIKIAAGQLQDDAFFSYVCALDEGEDPFIDKSCWIKTNPSLGVTIQEAYIEKLVTQARGMPSKESIVRRLNFSQWVGAESPWISPEVWFSAQEAIEPTQLYGRRCWGGLDLSSTTDLTSLVFLFEPDEDDPFWRLLPFFWVPAEGLQQKGERDGVDYQTWIRQGWLETTPGKAVDKAFVVRRLIEISDEYHLEVVGYDRWRIADLRTIADNEGAGVEFSDFGQGFKDMSPAVDKFETHLLNGTLKHNGNPVLTWCAANAVLDSDPAGNRKPTKRKSTGRIDGIVAAVIAIGISNVEDGGLVIDNDYEMLVM